MGRTSFEDMEACAAKWVKEIREKEQPDILIGLFHSGMDGKKLDNVVENGSKGVAANVPGFDVIFMGHDHTRWNERVTNTSGDSVLVIDPANNGKSSIGSDRNSEETEWKDCIKAGRWKAGEHG